MRVVLYKIIYNQTANYVSRQLNMAASQETLQDLREDRLQDTAGLPWDTAALRVQEGLVEANRDRMVNGTNPHLGKTSTMDLADISLERTR